MAAVEASLIIKWFKVKNTLKLFNAFVQAGQLADNVYFCAFIMALPSLPTPLLSILLGPTHWKVGVLIQSNTEIKIRSDSLSSAQPKNWMKVESQLCLSTVTLGFM